MTTPIDPATTIANLTLADKMRFVPNLPGVRRDLLSENKIIANRLLEEHNRHAATLEDIAKDYQNSVWHFVEQIWTPEEIVNAQL